MRRSDLPKVNRNRTEPRTRAPRHPAQCFSCSLLRSEGVAQLRLIFLDMYGPTAFDFSRYLGMKL